jgi:vitamin B12 transporter
MQSLKELRSINTFSSVLLSIVLLILPQKSAAQSSPDRDTVKITEVVITRKLISSEQPGFKFFSVDSGMVSRYSQFSLNDLLREVTPLYIKDYGAGLTSTSSFRGTSAGHTQVTWNGININDPMLGQTDFSLIPSGMIDNVLVSFGGASMDIGSGAIGGIINLGTEPSWDKGTIIDITSGMGSFGRFNGFLKVSTGTSRFQSVTRLFMNRAQNDFLYPNPESGTTPAMLTREYNNLHQESLMQEFYIRNKKNVFSARIWYQDASRELPGSTLYGYYGEKQSDESFRGLLSYSGESGKKEFFATAAYMNSGMRYFSYYDTAGAKNAVNTMILKFGMNFPVDNATKVKIVFNDEYNNVSSGYYADNVNHNNASLTVSAERKKGKWFGAAVLLRQTLDNSSLLNPDFSAGIELRTVPGEEHYLKVNIARNSKIASLNDRYWNPGGNRDLKNEYAYSFEAGYKLEHKIGNSLSTGAEINYFNNYIRNMIQWHPDTSFYWVAGNIGKANTSGIESSLFAKYNAGNFSLNFCGAYAWTTAKDITSAELSDNQMIYVPKHKANGSLSLSYRNLYSTWSTGYTGPVYILSDNSVSIKGYTLNSLTGGFKIAFRENFADIRLRIDNIFNVACQTIAYYPQPGRSYLMTLSLRFKA